MSRYIYIIYPTRLFINTSIQLSLTYIFQLNLVQNKLLPYLSLLMGFLKYEGYII